VVKRLERLIEGMEEEETEGRVGTDSVDVSVPSEQGGAELLGLTEDGSPVSLTAGSAGRSQATGQSSAGAEKGGVKYPGVQRSDAPGKPADLWVFLGGFLGWWSCLVWTIFAACNMTVYRLGLNSS
jgi:hypothetical protein